MHEIGIEAKVFQAKIYVKVKYLRKEIKCIAYLSTRKKENFTAINLKQIPFAYKQRVGKVLLLTFYDILFVMKSIDVFCCFWKINQVLKDIWKDTRNTYFFKT